MTKMKKNLVGDGAERKIIFLVFVSYFLFFARGGVKMRIEFLLFGALAWG